MADTRPDPFHAPDDAARTQAISLLSAARFGALGVIDPDTGAPSVSRIALAPGPDGAPLTLISDLSGHSRALAANPDCALLVGEPGPKGDPLSHPRLTLQARAEPVDKAALKARYLKAAPKAALYYDFTDFRLLRLCPQSAVLVAGFGRAFRLTAADLLPLG